MRDEPFDTLIKQLQPKPNQTGDTHVAKPLSKGPVSTDLLEKFDLLEETMSQYIFEREDEIAGMIWAMVAGVPVFFHGTPGIGKSYLVDVMDMFIEHESDDDYFSILLSRLTDPGEVFGPTSLKALREDRFERMIQGTLVTAKYAFLDEVFKSSSAILNQLLWIINERKYKHGTTLMRNAGPSVLYCASNEFAQDDSLKALYDRLVLRFEVVPLRDSQSFEKMLTTRLPSDPTPIISWSDVEQAQVLARQVVIPQVVIESITSVQRQLNEVGIEPSDRRFMRALQVVQAYAWLDGCMVADIEHLTPLEHILWETPEQRGDVAKVVLELANPLDGHANEILQELSALEDDLDGLSGSDDDRYTVGNEIHTKVLRAGDAIEKLEERAGGSRKRSKKLKAAGDKVYLLTNRVLAEVFSLPTDTTPPKR